MQEDDELQQSCPNLVWLKSSANYIVKKKKK